MAIRDPKKYFEEKYGWDRLPTPGGAELVLEPLQGDALDFSPRPGFTGFPKPLGRLRLVFESQQKFIEAAYYWLLHTMRHESGLPSVIKTIDTFAAAVQSSTFGLSEQRLSIQQDRAMQYLKFIADMVKALHQIVREIRITDERLGHYYASFRASKKAWEEAQRKGRKPSALPEGRSAEYALKGMWVDLVEGGGKNPASVYGMATQLNFITLPDLFFRTSINEVVHGKTPDELTPEEYEELIRTVPERVDEAVDPLEFNEKVKEVLKRKLIQYYIWKYRTFKELVERRKFMLHYLKQHYHTILLYLSWVKPYLANVKRLMQNQKLAFSPDIISTFESALLEVELLGVKGKEGRNAVVSAHLRYAAMPMQVYQAEYQRGNIYTGRMELTLRAYLFTDEELDAYKRFRQEEDFELLKEYDKAIASAIEALGEDLKKYLDEALNEKEEDGEKKAEEKKRGVRVEDTPFVLLTDLVDGFRELFGSLAPFSLKSMSEAKRADEKARKEKEAEDELKKTALEKTALIYTLYKKTHGLLSW